MEVSRESGDPIDEKIEQIRKIIPECFTEKMLDSDKLTKLFGKKLNTEDEKYTFSWAGKNATIQNTRTSSKGSLIPDKDESVNFEDSQNIFIEGENLEVLKLLRRSYYGKIKMIYIDPPYNTGHDFIYHDDFKNSVQSYLEQTGQSQNRIKCTSQPQAPARFPTDWLSFMYSRLSLAHDFLTEAGVIFV
ncbi:MAG: site-specific DNA-methyltransferase, partial [Nitrosopumilus sp.]|nr:site-specific DNA-methyltransferase [Nitrosopumilus sp.]